MIHNRSVLGIVPVLLFGVPAFGQVGGTSEQPKGSAPAMSSVKAAPRELTGDDALRVEALERTRRFLRDQGKYAEAEPLYRNALAIRRRVLGEDHPDTATSYNNLALPPRGQGKYAEAEPLYRKALAIRRGVLGEDHPDTAPSYNNLAFYLRPRASTPRPSRSSARRWRSAAASWARTTPTRPPATTTWPASSRPRASTPRPSRSTARRWRSAAASWARTTPTRPPATTTWPLNLDAQGKYAEAEPLFRKALDDPPQGPGRGPPRHGRQLQQPGRHPDAQGKYAEAEPLFRKALAIRRSVLGEDHPDTAAGYNNLAGLLRRTRASTPRPSRSSARRWRSAARSWARNTPTPPPATTTWPLNLNAQGKYAEAEPLFRKALAICRQRPGRGPPRHRRQATTTWPST